MNKSLVTMMLLSGFSFHQSAYANLEVEFRANFTQPTCALTGPGVVDLGSLDTNGIGVTPFTLTTTCEAGATVALWAEAVRGTRDPLSRTTIEMVPSTPIALNETNAKFFLYGETSDIFPWGNGIDDASIRFCATDGTAGTFRCELEARSYVMPTTGRGSYSAVVRFSMVYQ